jgi:beta-N-acetylhexosaminidase
MANHSKKKIKLGLEQILTDKKTLLNGLRVGLICNQASVDHEFRHAADLLHEDADINLTTLFGPQHGIRGDVQDNMVETGHSTDKITGLPIYSLYSETRIPTEEMLANVDALVFDLQDVGCRIYTFVYTMANCMTACAKYGKKMFVCDRPNPITGKYVEGNVTEPGHESFVGQYNIAARHGMTAGELASMFKDDFGIGCDLEIVKMENWAREDWYDDTDAPWVLPSPNIPTVDTAVVFPATVVVEGTQVSEGRGTTKPFELVGAPYIDSKEYSEALNALDFPGVRFRAAEFLPTFQKHAGKTCGGVQLHVTDREAFTPVIVGLAMVKVIFDLYGSELKWKEGAYEYVFDRNPFDVINGTEKIRLSIENGGTLDDLKALQNAGLDEFLQKREKHLLY